MAQLPNQYRAIVMSESQGKPGEVWHPLSISNFPLPSPGKDQVLIKINAVSLNHRDIWIRKGVHFDIACPSILGSDFVGTVVAPASSPWVGKRVLPYPAIGWLKDTKGPDVPGKQFGVYGGTKQSNGIGAFAEYICVDASSCVEAPRHLSDEAAAAVPMASLTAWRALVTKAGVKAGDNVLITGVGGGVASQALQLAVALGARVWVTSSSEKKLQMAKEHGAEGGVCYSHEGWPDKLKSMLPSSKPYLDIVIDSCGGDIVTKCGNIMHHGGVFVGYGAASGQPVTITMNAIDKNLEYKGTMLGSFAEYKTMIDFMGKHQLEPIVNNVVEGLDHAEEGFQIMQKGEQFGNIVIKIGSGDAGRTRRS